MKGFDCLQCDLLHSCLCSMQRFLQTSSSTWNHYVPHEPTLHVFYLVFVSIYCFLTCKWQGCMSFAFSHKWGCFSISVVLKTAKAPLSAWNLHCRSFLVRFIFSNLITNHTYRNLHMKTAWNYDDGNRAISSETLKTIFNPLMTFFIIHFHIYIFYLPWVHWRQYSKYLRNSKI